MIKLSDRLQLIANQIETGETMADIGTDHGFLPLYLVERGICPHVILADISKGSLEKARVNIKELYESAEAELNFDFRLGDGIKVLENGEVSNVVIAGMGGILMTEILGADIEKTRSLGKLILQPRNKPGILCHWLEYHGFEVKHEFLVREGKYICEIIVAEPSKESHSQEESYFGTRRSGAVCEAEEIIPYEFETPKKIMDDNSREITESYIARKLRTEEKIEKAILMSESPETSRLEETRKRIEYLQKMLQDITEKN